MKRRKQRTDVGPRPEETIVPQFTAGQWHTIRAIMEKIIRLFSPEEFQAAFEEGLAEGLRYGRRWARSGTSNRDELERLQQFWTECGGGLFGWLNSIPPPRMPAHQVFDVVHPERAGDADAADAWWRSVLPRRVWELVLELGDFLIVVGFVIGAIKVYENGKAGSS